jgi:hypothetical protein
MSHDEGVLKKADTPGTARPIENRLHQFPPYPVTLRSRIDDDRANRPDRVTLAEKIETDDCAVIAFGDRPKD